MILIFPVFIFKTSSQCGVDLHTTIPPELLSLAMNKTAGLRRQLFGLQSVPSV